jgi:hypothetical protein
MLSICCTAYFVTRCPSSVSVVCGSKFAFLDSRVSDTGTGLGIVSVIEQQERVGEYMRSAPVDVRNAWKSYQDRNPKGASMKIKSLLPPLGQRCAAV